MVPSKKEILAQLASLLPGAQKIIIHYEGSGDNFNSFDELAVIDADNKNMAQFENYQVQEEVLKIVENYIFDSIFARAHCTPNFNNEGSSGTITFDLLNKVVILENSYWEDVTEYPEDDNEDYEYEEAEEKCDPEEF
jgi:ornithine carbamoyltransferase